MDGYYQYIECEIKCAECKHYESYHRYNDYWYATHYCKKCKSEIDTRWRGTPWDPFLPKACYFNNYFEESDEVKKKRESANTIGIFGYDFDGLPE